MDTKKAMCSVSSMVEKMAASDGTMVAYLVDGMAAQMVYAQAAWMVAPMVGDQVSRKVVMMDVQMVVGLVVMLAEKQDGLKVEEKVDRLV